VEGLLLSADYDTVPLPVPKPAVVTWRQTRKEHTVSDCLFCKFVSGEIEPDVVFENDSVLAFRDINPQAPTHVLVVPKEHISTLNDLDSGHRELVGELYLAAKEVARAEGIDERGYRTVMNCNAEAGQTVFHIHLHLLGGRGMSWPPG